MRCRIALLLLTLPVFASSTSSAEPLPAQSPPPVTIPIFSDIADMNLSP